MSKDKPTPFKWNGRRNSELRENITRAESPDCTGQTTDTTFISREELETRFNAASETLRIPFLFRELGLRLLYNPDNDNYYSHLRSQNTYQDDFTSLTSNTDYAHKLFSNIRNNHRFLKSKIKEGSQINKTEKKIKFSESIKVKETYQSATYKNHYLDTLEQEVIYSGINGYANYYEINYLINSIARAYGYSSISESFKQILRGEEVNHASLDQEEIKTIYQFFYHLFVIEGSRDPASYITIPLAFEYLSTHRGNIFGSDEHHPEIIPVCFKNAMGALSYMGDVTFRDLTSIQYSHSYNGTHDGRKGTRKRYAEIIQEGTNLLLRKHLGYEEEEEEEEEEPLPGFSSTLNIVEDICRQWYGFTPQMEAPEIQFFGQLGLTATDVPRDGNCFFHVLAKYYEADESELREFAADILGDDSIIEDGNWIDLNFAEIAQALALEWDVNIVLVEQNVALDQIDTMLEANLYRANTPDAETIYIGNIGNMHFVDLTPEEGEEFTQLQAAVDRIVNPQPPVVEEPLENLGNITQALEQAANEPNDEEEDGSSSDNSSNSTVNALYRIDYNDLDFLNHRKIDQPYQLTMDEEHVIDNFILYNNQCNYSAEHKVVILPQEISDFTFNDMSMVLGKLLNYFSQ